MENKLPPLLAKMPELLRESRILLRGFRPKSRGCPSGEVDSRLLSFKSWLLFSKERLSIFRRREALIKYALLREELYV